MAGVLPFVRGLDFSQNDFQVCFNVLIILQMRNKYLLVSLLTRPLWKSTLVGRAFYLSLSAKPSEYAYYFYSSIGTYIPWSGRKHAQFEMAQTRENKSRRGAWRNITFEKSGKFVLYFRCNYSNCDRFVDIFVSKLSTFKRLLTFVVPAVMYSLYI